MTSRSSIQPYRSPEAKSFMAELKNPSGHWTAVYINYATNGYNPKLVGEKEAPRRWEDFLDPSGCGLRPAIRSRRVRAQAI